MKIEDIEVGDKVVYIPEHLLGFACSETKKEANLGVVTSKNDKYVFVRYFNMPSSQATNAEDLYSLKNRPDLSEKIIARENE